MRSRRTATTAIAAALLASLLAAGCGEAEIDVGKATKFIDAAVTEQVGAQVKSVKCPESVKAKAKDKLRNRSRSTRDAIVSCPQIVVVGKGRTFACSAKIDGDDRTVAARQTDAKGNFTYNVLTG